jgi:hypothetical protein
MYFADDELCHHKEHDPQWRRKRKHIYHQLSSLFSNYPELGTMASICHSYPIFSRICSEIIDPNDPNLRKRPIRKHKSMFFGPNDAILIFRAIADAHRNAPESYY